MTDNPLPALAAALDARAEAERAARRPEKPHVENAEHRGAARAFAEAARMVRRAGE